MCGIFGFNKLTEQTRQMAYLLAYAMEDRGLDSWGASDGTEVIKLVGPISESFYIPPEWSQGIFHTRGASVGSVCERNAHPFVISGELRKVIGIHNGHVTNWQALNKQYSRSCQVDSEHLFEHIANGKPMHELEGRGTLVWFQDDEFNSNLESTIHLARWNYGDLEVAELTDNNGLVFCSTRIPILRAARFVNLKIKAFYQPPVDCIEYYIREQELFQKADLGFRNKPFNYSEHRSSHGTSFYGASQRDVADYSSSHTDLEWKKCKRCHNQETKRIVCAGCMRTFYQKFDQLMEQSNNSIEGLKYKRMFAAINAM